ncbi:hypothetical protein [Lewinella sp. IMCC34183]|uniref:hypothetical protein n=1 Tax=Lewinella sp. IMCC34183 TaxID=2248762 RepID=UPI00130050D9|nr:hypothetical protein [Lewinella sp. IMCC34183]
MKYLLSEGALLLLCALLLSGCGRDESGEGLLASQEEEPKFSVHNNIVILPDLSNRTDQTLYPRNVTDEEIIGMVVDMFPDMTRYYHRRRSQRDKLTLQPINYNDVPNYTELEDALTFDLGVFENQGERASYLFDRSDNNLSADIKKFKGTVPTFYKGTENGYASDLYGFFRNRMKNQPLFQLTQARNNEAIVDDQRKVLILLTDGYMDLATDGPKSCPDKQCRRLTQHVLKDFRRDCKCSQNPDSAAEFFASSGYGIPPVDPANLEGVEVLMLEVYDRSKTTSGRKTVYPTDFDVLELFWTDFFKKSGAKRFHMVETAVSEAAIRTEIQNFLAEDKYVAATPLLSAAE